MRWLVEGEKYLKVKVPDFGGMNNYPSILENNYYSLYIYIYIYSQNLEKIQLDFNQILNFMSRVLFNF